MPTGYTAEIYDGKQTEFKEFAMQCARAFGALIMMRDEPMDAEIPEKFEPTSYHLEAVKAARARQAELEVMTPAQCESAALTAYTTAMDERKRYIEDKAALRLRYEAMLTQVQAWTPPTPDHRGLKDFMVEQLDRSIDGDCSIYGDAPQQQTGAQWLAAQMASVKHDIEYHSKHHAEEIERTNGRTEWVRALRESLR